MVETFGNAQFYDGEIEEERAMTRSVSEFSFNIIDYLVDEIKNNPKDNTMKSDNEDANNSYEGTNIEE